MDGPNLLSPSHNTPFLTICHQVHMLFLSSYLISSHLAVSDVVLSLKVFLKGQRFSVFFSVWQMKLVFGVYCLLKLPAERLFLKLETLKYLPSAVLCIWPCPLHSLSWFNTVYFLISKQYKCNRKCNIPQMNKNGCFS